MRDDSPLGRLLDLRPIVLWHPDSPGVKVQIQPGLLRRLGIRRSEFATSGETLKMYRDRKRLAGKT